MKKQKLNLTFYLIFFVIFFVSVVYAKLENTNDDSEESSDEEEDEELSSAETETYKYLAKRLKQSAVETRLASRSRPVARPYAIPGPQEPLPGRSHNGDYWPVFPFSNQYSGGLDLDPSISRHIGGDINIPIPSWGMMDITGRFFNRISDTTTKFGYINHPVNMLGLNKDDFATLVSDPRLQANRNLHPTLPLGKVAKSNVPMSCKPPMCNPYTGTFHLGVEHDIGGHDGNEGDINIPFPVSKGIAYRFPFGGLYYYDLDNITITYGHNLAPLDPYANPYFFKNDYTRRRELLPPEPNVFPRRQKRSSVFGGFAPVYSQGITEPNTNSQKVSAKDFKSYKPMQKLKKLITHGNRLNTTDIHKLEDIVEAPFHLQYLNPKQIKQMGIKLSDVLIPANALSNMERKSMGFMGSRDYKNSFEAMLPFEEEKMMLDNFMMQQQSPYFLSDHRLSNVLLPTEAFYNMQSPSFGFLESSDNDQNFEAMQVQTEIMNEQMMMNDFMDQLPIYFDHKLSDLLLPTGGFYNPAFDVFGNMEEKEMEAALENEQAMIINNNFINQQNLQFSNEIKMSDILLPSEIDNNLGALSHEEAMANEEADILNNFMITKDNYFPKNF